MATELTIIILLVAAAAGALWLRGVLRERRRERLRRTALSPCLRDILQDKVSFYPRLPPELRRRLDGDVNVFLNEKRFYGRGGLRVTDEMRVIIAAHACLLTLNRPRRYYPTFTSVIIYPTTYVATERVFDGTVMTTRASARAGESWRRGPLVLAWSDTLGGIANPRDGHNVILHEFAHKLDEQDGVMDGAPELGPGQRRSWPAIFSLEFASLQQAVSDRHATLMDTYGASSPPEFFAVAVETFFERPVSMQREHPELYAELCGWFRLDPAAWRR